MIGVTFNFSFVKNLWEARLQSFLPILALHHIHDRKAVPLLCCARHKRILSRLFGKPFRRRWQKSRRSSGNIWNVIAMHELEGHSGRPAIKMSCIDTKVLMKCVNWYKRAVWNYRPKVFWDFYVSRLHTQCGQFLCTSVSRSGFTRSEL